MKVDLGVILSLTTGKLLVNPIQLHEVIDYIYSEYKIPLFDTMQQADLTSRYVLHTHPSLTGVGVTEQFNTIEEINSFLEQQKLIYGNSFNITPITEIMAHNICSENYGRSR